MPAHETRLRVRYAETDQMGVVYHANYLIWMEMGRVEYCRAQGLRYKDMERDGVLLAVVDVQCRYVSPARYDEEILVSTWIAAAAPRMVRFGYQMREIESARILATAETRHIFCNRELKPMKLPVKYRGLFGLANGDEK